MLAGFKTLMDVQARCRRLIGHGLVKNRGTPWTCGSWFDILFNVLREVDLKCIFIPKNSRSLEIESVVCQYFNQRNRQDKPGQLVAPIWRTTLCEVGKCSRCPIGAVKVSKVNVPLTRSVTSGTNDPSHTDASSPTSGSSCTFQHVLLTASVCTTTILVGGKKFCTTIDTLTQREPDSMLAAMFTGRRTISQDPENGFVFVDRDGKHFRHILNWLRDGAVPVLKDSQYAELLREAGYYQLFGLIDGISDVMNQRKKNEESDAELTRIDIIKCIQSERVRFRGVNLSGLDLSKLDLSFVDFSYACITNVFFSRANLQCAKFRDVDAEGANFHNSTLREGWKPSSVVLSLVTYACLIDCSFCQADLRSAHLQNADLTNANLEGAILEGANMKGAKLSNTNLRGANLQRAYLRQVNLKDTHLEGAKLDGANLLGAIR
ncbi:hypothetical protein FEM48_Zijuj12G0137300 [Ziziphus jujuba var. spinosa]|uniref:BTB domain-containing protein n=1 Tax=Ziziphus jujuba var. spinosa TaxID=714518 RepID=A0A978UDN9_ZIZJJ|nr:hypothetical protein FEM48_Zijuj12G0137300 [Ziziphus jujuba var. spinosa]